MSFLNYAYRHLEVYLPHPFFFFSSFFAPLSLSCSSSASPFLLLLAASLYNKSKKKKKKETFPNSLIQLTRQILSTCFSFPSHSRSRAAEPKKIILESVRSLLLSVRLYSYPDSQAGYFLQRPFPFLWLGHVLVFGLCTCTLPVRMNVDYTQTALAAAAIQAR